MKTNANQTTSTIYYRPLKQWIEVTPEQKRDWERFVGATRKRHREAYHHGLLRHDLFY